MNCSADRLTCGDNNGEDGHPFLACITCTPAMVHGAVDQVNVAIRHDAHWGQTPCLPILIHTLHDEHLVIQVVALPGLPGIFVRTRAISDDAWKQGTSNHNKHLIHTGCGTPRPARHPCWQISHLGRCLKTGNIIPQWASHNTGCGNARPASCFIGTWALGADACK